MFLQQKKTGEHTWLHLVENRWENGRCRQQIIATYGRVDELEESGELERLMRSTAGYCLDDLAARRNLP